MCPYLSEMHKIAKRAPFLNEAPPLLLTEKRSCSKNIRTFSDFDRILRRSIRYAKNLGYGPSVRGGRKIRGSKATTEIKTLSHKQLWARALRGFFMCTSRSERQNLHAYGWILHGYGCTPLAPMLYCLFSYTYGFDALIRKRNLHSYGLMTVDEA